MLDNMYYVYPFYKEWMRGEKHGEDGLGTTSGSAMSMLPRVNENREASFFIRISGDFLKGNLSGNCIRM